MTHPTPETLSAWLDGDLSGPEAEAIAQQLDDDAALADDLQTLRALKRVLAEAEPPEAPAGFTDRFMERLDEEEGPERPWSTPIAWERWALAAAALIALTLAWPRPDVVETAPAARPTPTVGFQATAPGVAYRVPHTLQLDASWTAADLNAALKPLNLRLQPHADGWQVQLSPEQALTLEHHLREHHPVTRVSTQAAQPDGLRIVLKR